MRTSRTRWLIRSCVAATLLWPVVWTGVEVYAFFTGNLGADCSKVMVFVGGSMPADAREIHCRNNGGWLDRSYTAEFRMPRTDLAARLAEAFPRVRPGTAYGPGLSFSNSQEPNEARPSRQAMTVYLNAEYDSDGTARVKLQAFDV
ncbi:hypothetical protein [Kitasatospora sp. NPDC096204]|uniref:hypothetical protein n=1 Tax=Kitasatospora sp. NPDC096204 TaxID=3364094 RepID=UPI0037F2410F